ncbi:metallophosphoesterase [Cohnella soli]|uniref:Metallophosphoesterase n=1 Tax=Cohnella soli TaxID=425005 RepID=A0ABW0I675_9BACL
MKDQVHISRKEFLKKGFRWLGGSAVTASAAAYGYSRWIEPHRLEITEHLLSYPGLPLTLVGKRIVQFSDVHLDHHFGISRFQALAQSIMKLRPDMICFTGDLYHVDAQPTSSACSGILHSLEAPLGKWAVLGNHDYVTSSSDVTRTLTEGGFTVLDNRSHTLDYRECSLRVAGVDDAMRGNPDLQLALGGPGSADFTLLLAHEPDLADQASAFSVDLQLSGHSHGGQVKLPWIGAVVLPEMARKYSEGLYKIRDGMYLYTNRGVGVSAHPVRFLCRPELTVLTLG